MSEILFKMKKSLNCLGVDGTTIHGETSIQINAPFLSSHSCLLEFLSCSGPKEKSLVGEKKLQLYIMPLPFHLPCFCILLCALGISPASTASTGFPHPLGSGWVQPMVSYQEIRWKGESEVKIFILSPFCQVAMNWPTPPPKFIALLNTT